MTRADSAICLKECLKLEVGDGRDLPGEWLCPKISYPRNLGMCRLRAGDTVPDACPFGSYNSGRSRNVMPDGSCFTG
jgi:hypothetical protein